MKTSEDWLIHFKENQTHQRIDWQLSPQISSSDKKHLLRSLKAWQKGETSEGLHLLKAARSYAKMTDDPDYVEAIRYFIKEEQKHGENLGMYIDAIGEKRTNFDWGDQLFRYVRGWNKSITSWTMAVLVVESAAQLFYQALKDASDCPLLKQICTDILIDEAYHIDFQSERLAIIMQLKSPFWRSQYLFVYKLLFEVTHRLIWSAHSKAFIHGGCDRQRYSRGMRHKFNKSLGVIERAFVAKTVDIHG